MRYRIKVFLLLTGFLVAATVAWEVVQDRSHANEREAWGAVRDSVLTGQARLDSLRALLARLDDEVTVGKRALGLSRERIGHLERQARGGSLPATQQREYARQVESHNRSVASYNARLVEMQRVYEEYAALAESHNALVDSANAMQRRATQEGYGLPEAEPAGATRTGAPR